MARVNSIDSYEFLKNMPSKNPNNFSAVDKDKNQAVNRATFVRIIDVEETDDERTITNDRTSLLLRSLKNNWNILNAQPVTQSTLSRPNSAMQSSTDDKPSGSNRRTAEAIDEAESMPATKHRRQS